MILVTGATGFIGRSLVTQLQSRNRPVRAVVRRPGEGLAREVNTIEVSGLGDQTDWSKALVGVTAVVHAAARVHVMNDEAPDPLFEYRKTNVEGTVRLAQQCAAHGVKRFVFLSSIKANGESTDTRPPFRADDEPAPQDPYGVSKVEAEHALFELAKPGGMEVTIIRPPLVYGPGVKANFRSMMRLLRMGIPLPFGSIDNKRSLVARDNLVDLIITCLDHPKAANQVFLVSDGQDISTTELLRSLSLQLGQPARLIPIPGALLMMVACAVGKRDLARRLCGSLQVDMSKTRDLLGWTPPVALQEGLKRVAESYAHEAGI